MYVNWYYLHFPAPVSADDVREAFVGDLADVKVKDVYAGSFELFTTLSYSKVKHALDQWFPEADFYVCKVKGGDVHVPLNPPRR